MKYFFLSFLILCSSLLAQNNFLDVRLQLNKRAYLSFEHVYANVIITNNSAQDINLRADELRNWLEFDITRNNVKKIKMAKNFLFAQTTIRPGESKSRKVALTQMYPLVSQGNYTIRAQINSGKQNRIAVSKPAFFDVIKGVTIFQRQTGIPHKPNEIIEYRILSLNTVDGSQLYFQNYNPHPKKKRILATFSLGKYMHVNRPQFIIDRQGHLNVLFQVNDKMFRYLKFKETGQIVSQKLYRMTDRGRPALVKTGKKGDVIVWNAALYDLKKEAKKRAAIHNISQRPPFVY